MKINLGQFNSGACFYKKPDYSMYVCSGFVKDILDRSYYEAPAVDIHLADKRPHQIGWRLVKYSISDYNTNNVSVLIDGRTRTYCFTEKQIKQN